LSLYQEAPAILWKVPLLPPSCDFRNPWFLHSQVWNICSLFSVLPPRHLHCPVLHLWSVVCSWLKGRHGRSDRGDRTPMHLYCLLWIAFPGHFPNCSFCP
jgi:hypothetical protein